jgi:hypothetical protein
MTSPHRALAIGLVALSPLVLAGCEKPYPGVTVWSGTSSEHAAALCWQFQEGASLGPRDCAEDVLAQAGSGEGITRLEVSPGATVGISVDPVVADSGWSVQIAGQTLAAGLTDTYYRFTFPEQVAAEGPGYTLQVIAAASDTGSRGYWFFQLVPR